MRVSGVNEMNLHIELKLNSRDNQLEFPCVNRATAIGVEGVEGNFQHLVNKRREAVIREEKW